MRFRDPYLAVRSQWLEEQVQITDAISPVGVVKTVVNPTVSDPCGTYTPSADTYRDIIILTTYDAAGRHLENSDPNGKATSYQYDDLGRLVSETNPLDHTNGYTYDGMGNRLTMTDARNVTTRYEYDALNRLTAVVENYIPGLDPTNEINVRTEYTYDAVGNRKTIKDALNHVTTFSYDDLGRLRTERDPLDHTTTYGYDDIGNRVSLLDTNGYTTTFAYDGLDRLIAMDYPAPDADVGFTYDDSGDRATMSDGLGTTSWTYDDLNRTITITHPVSGTVGYHYDALGNRRGLVYSDSKQVVYDYDLVGRMHQITDWDSQVITYTHDRTGRLVEIALPAGLKSAYEYDDAGHLTDITHTNNGLRLSTYVYTYDALGNRSVVTETTYSLSQVNLALVMAEGEEEGEGMQAMAAPEAYPPSGVESLEEAPLPKVKSAYPAPLEALPEAESLETLTTPTPQTAYPQPTSGETSWLERLRGLFDRLLAWLAPSSAAARETNAPLQSVAGEPEQVVIVYTYDPLNRLTAADYSDGAYFHYTYDAVGNRASQTVNGQVTSYQYDNANRLTSVNGVTYTWDDNGNLLSDGVYNYSYDYANRLASASDSVHSFSFAYNGLGDRYQQTINSVTTTYFLDIAGGLTQVLSDGTYTYLYGVNRLSQQHDTVIEYYLGDALGSLRQLVDISGNVTLAKSYQPFGETLASEGSGVSSYGFTGEWMDGYIKLVYLRSRYYSPGTGRFLIKDSWLENYTKPLSLNRWNYVESNPINRIDPSGHSPLWCGVPLIGCVNTAKNAVLAAKAAYSQVGPILLALSQKNPWNNRFNCLDPRWSKPDKAIYLLADYFCERGPDWVVFYGNDALSVELAKSVLLDEVRKEYYNNGDISDPKGRKFNIPEFGLALLDAIESSTGEISLPLAHILGSFDYRVVKSPSGRVDFQINNRTDLASGTHIPFRFPPNDERDNPLSLEQFILEHPEMENMGVMVVLINHSEIVSILRQRDRSATGFLMGGGNMRQTFNWNEKYLDCGLQKLPWPVYLPLLDIR